MKCRRTSGPAGRKRSSRIPLLCLLGLALTLDAAAQSTHLVRMGNFFFNPAALTIQAGDTVTWTNTTTSQHDSHQQTNLWDGPLLGLGGTFSHRFTNAGFYPYYCTPHLNFNQTGAVTAVTAPANLPPTVAIGNPADGSVFTAPARLNLNVTASDPDGTVIRVGFFTNASLLGEVTSPPFKFLWDNVPAGSYALTAVATDNAGASSTSSVVQVTVEGAAGPQVTITSPTHGAVLPAPASFDITATASRGTTEVEFLVDNLSLDRDTSNPYRTTVANLPAGVHTLTAVATDALGQKGTNNVVITVNLAPVVQITGPADGTGFLAPASFTLEAAASDADGSIARIQLFRGTTLLGTLATNAVAHPIQGLAAGTHTFTATATDNLGGQASQAIQVVVKARPTVAIAAPAANARLTNRSTLFTGTAGDSFRVSAVHYALNGGAFQPATGTTNWSQALDLPPGTNRFSVRSVDALGLLSLTNTRSVFQVVPSPLALLASGQGTVSGASNGQVLEIGRGYLLTANPAPNYVFSNWTGRISGSERTLRFLMESNLTLQANFVPNPWQRVSGTFQGLFSEETSVRQASSGEFRLRVTPTGRYSVTLNLAGKRLAATGNLDLTGRATNTLLRPGAPPLVARWIVDLQGRDEVTGTLTDGAWTSSLLGVRGTFHALTNRAPLAGRHTLVLAGAGTPGLDLGDGWGTLTINPAGLGTLAGSLADGTRLTRSALLSKGGDWPLFAGLYGQQGGILGWVHFDTNAPADDLRGQPYWIRPALTNAALYPAGFFHQPLLTGSRYLAPAGSSPNLIAVTNAALILNGGNLSQAWTNDVVLGPNNLVTNLGTNRLSVTLSAGNGLFRGTFLDPALGRTVQFNGALLQKSARGAGFFTGTNLTGQVLLQGPP